MLARGHHGIFYKNIISNNPTYVHWNGILHTQPVFPTVSHGLHFRSGGGDGAVSTEKKT